MPGWAGRKRAEALWSSADGVLYELERIQRDLIKLKRIQEDHLAKLREIEEKLYRWWRKG